MSNKIMRLPAVLAEIGLSKTTLYNRVESGLWPKPVSLGPRAVGWPAREVLELNAAVIAGRSEEEIRRLVSRLYDDRQTCHEVV